MGNRRYYFLFASLFAVLLLGSVACQGAPASAPSPEYTVMTMSLPAGRDYLVDGSGRTLYYFTKDSAGKSSANEAVLLLWPIFYTAELKVPSNLNASDFGNITRSDGKKQTTYKGMPLYYFSKDAKAGDTAGQGFKDLWSVVKP